MKIIDQIVEEKLKDQIPRNCFTCIHFGFKPDSSNRQCLYPGVLRYKHDLKCGECQKWMLQPDRRRRVKFLTTYSKKEKKQIEKVKVERR